MLAEIEGVTVFLEVAGEDRKMLGIAAQLTVLNSHHNNCVVQRSSKVAWASIGSSSFCGWVGT